MKRLTVIAAVTVAAAVAATVSITSTGSSDRKTRIERKSLHACGPVLSFGSPETFKPYKLYALGCVWREWPLNDVIYDNEVVPPLYYQGPIRSKRLIYVTFLYGGSIQLQVQIWPACERSRSSYTSDPPGPIKLTLPRKDTTIRGVPAAWFFDRGRLELYTGSETVVLYRHEGVSARDLREAAEAVAGVNNAVRAGEPLPKPIPGALEGKLRCE